MLNETEVIVFWIILVCTVLSAIADMLQLGIQWFQLRELGDLDDDKDDWWEHDEE